MSDSAPYAHNSNTVFSIFHYLTCWEYASNNWVKIYDMDGVEVFSIDMEKGNARFEADLPDGMYTVKTFHNGFETPIQEFLIGRP
ncbi:MAG: T9SS type A sorting domain-containing protein [Actinobacteria bacterium]|nr:T9SS type A sorting domain-containing protein [Actinomycetota bacterium]